MRKKVNKKIAARIERFLIEKKKRNNKFRKKLEAKRRAESQSLC